MGLSRCLRVSDRGFDTAFVSDEAMTTVVGVLLVKELASSVIAALKQLSLKIANLQSSPAHGLVLSVVNLAN